MMIVMTEMMIMMTKMMMIMIIMMMIPVISDADTTDKIEEQMFNTLGGGALPHPSGNISIWEPRQDNPLLLEKQLFFSLRRDELEARDAISNLDEFSSEELNSTYKIYCPPHLLESNNYIR